MIPFLSSTIQILHPGNGDLILHFPPEYLASIPLAVLGFPMAIIFGMLIKQTGLRPLSILFLAGFIPLGLFFYVVTQSSTLMFSKTANNLVIEDHVFFRTTRTSYPLANVDHAEVALDDGKSHMLYLALTSGDRIATGSGWTARKGHYQAADAVNQFISSSGRVQGAPSLHAPSVEYEKKLDAARKAFLEQSTKSQKQGQP